MMEFDPGLVNVWCENRFLESEGWFFYENRYKIIGYNRLSIWQMFGSQKQKTLENQVINKGFCTRDGT